MHVQLCMTTTCWLASLQIPQDPASSFHSVTVSVKAVLASTLVCQKLVGCRVTLQLVACSLQLVD
jgi:hypothetical protein